MSPDLQIYLLGWFRLSVGGSVVANAAWQKRKAKLLVQILALRQSHSLHREELIEMLFPETDLKTANDNLYRIIYAARRALEPNRSSYGSSTFIATEGPQIKLTSEKGLWIDAVEFEEKARKGLKTSNQNLLEAAAELYRGDLLADEPFEERFIDRRDRLKELFVKVLQRLAENSEKQKNIEEAHQWWDKVLEKEPADEAAHRAKMRLFYEQGERSRALRQYEKCVEVLKREFLVEPEQETHRLRQKILAGGCG